jgi:hypothetical protein
MEEGFRSQGEYVETQLPNCIPLVNSVASAEIARINSFFQGEDGYSAGKHGGTKNAALMKENHEFNA